MNLIRMIMRALGWPAPAVVVREPKRKLRAACEFCGRDIAITQHGRMYKHGCTKRDA